MSRPKLVHKAWDALTLHNKHWYIAGLFLISCMIPNFGVPTLVLGIITVSLLLIAYLREG